MSIVKKRVTDLITIDMVRKWENNIYTITAGTGAGKSYFIKNIVYLVAREKNQKILFLVHRTNCKNQFQYEINRDFKGDTIIVRTYQFLEKLNNIDSYLKQFNYIVSDEFHYWISDAAFNATTEISFNAILNANHTKRIFMSATSNKIIRFIKEYGKKTIDYELNINYNFNEVNFFYKDDTLEQFIKDCIKKKQKAIFFIQKAEKAYNLYRKYEKYCIFNCSKNNEKYYKYVNTKKIEKILDTEGFKKEDGFKENILITTTCMDAGVNIIDTKLHHIICDVTDYDTLIQCIGRKRIQNKDDYLVVYIKVVTNLRLGGLITEIKKKIEMANYLKEHTTKEFLKKYIRQSDKNNIIYNKKTNNDDTNDECILKVNELMYTKNILDIYDFEEMISMGKYGYCKFLKKILKIKDYGIMEENENNEELINFLDEYVTNNIIMLNVKERKELIEKIDVKSNGKLLKSIDSLNSALKERKINFMIVALNKITKTIDGKKKQFKTPWKVIKLG